MKTEREEVRKTPTSIQERVPDCGSRNFKGAGEWEQKNVSAACEINPDDGPLPNEFIYIDLESVSSGRLLERKRYLRTEAPSRAQRLLKTGDVIFQLVRPYQRNNLLCDFGYDSSYVASTGYAQLRPRESSEYIYQLVHTDRFVESVISKCTGSSYPAITSRELGEIQATFPSLPEQRENSCLPLLPRRGPRITAHTKKLESLNAYKKGLMQTLFPGDGREYQATLPRVWGCGRVGGAVNW